MEITSPSARSLYARVGPLRRTPDARVRPQQRQRHHRAHAKEHARVRATGRTGHAGECVIHMLLTGLIGSQKAEGGRVTCGDERSERCIIWGAEEFDLGRVANEEERVSVAAEEVLE
eukprot:1622821-Pleurochrysis_carterae.AAC.2